MGERVKEILGEAFTNYMAATPLDVPLRASELAEVVVEALSAHGYRVVREEDQLTAEEIQHLLLRSVPWSETRCPTCKATHAKLRRLTEGDDVGVGLPPTREEGEDDG